MQRRDFLRKFTILSAAVIALPVATFTFKMPKAPVGNIWAEIIADPGFPRWNPEAKRQKLLRGMPKHAIAFDDIQTFSGGKVHFLDHDPHILGPTPR